MDRSQSPATFTIRPAAKPDAATLTLLRRALFRELGQRPEAEWPATFEGDSTAAFAEGLERGSCRAWIAEAGGGKPVGSVALLLFPRLPTPDALAVQEGYLVNVYTVPEWRRRGIAAALVAAAVDEARALALCRIRLHATEEGRPIYAAAGFRSRKDEMELRF